MFFVGQVGGTLAVAAASTMYATLGPLGWSAKLADAAVALCGSCVQVIKQQLADGVSVRRVGFVSSGAPARQHSEILTPEGQRVGEITSGAFSPCLKKNIAMG